LVGGVLTLLIVGAAGFFSMHMRGKSAASVITDLPSLPSRIATAATTNFFWDTVSGPPIPAPVGTGAEGFVGRIRVRGEDTLWIAGFEGNGLSVAWKAGPFGTYSQGYQSTFTTVVGRDVVVTDYRANVHVYDVATGKELRSAKLSDRANAMCAAPDGKGHVWIATTDEKHVLFDVEAGTLTASPRPAWCPDLWAANGDCRGWLKRGAPRLECKGPEAAPKVPSFEAINVVEEGDLAVALGKKHPGTAVPIAVGYDPKTKAVRWEQSIASGDQAGVTEISTTSIMDALAGGRFVAPYELTSKGWHFTAFDARTGQRVWDAPLQSTIGSSDPEGFSLSATRLYVMRTSSLEVYDAKTGAQVGSVGD
jgi:outer membrane protein assembly factor BamB